MKKILRKIFRLLKTAGKWCEAKLSDSSIPVEPKNPEAYRLQNVDLYGSLAAEKGIAIKYSGNGAPITVSRGNQQFIVSADHSVYLGDLSNQFDYYFSSTIPDKVGEMEVIDYSKPGWHTMKDSGQRLYCTSIAEDWGATKDYLDYLTPHAGEVVIDVGAYCGLSVLAFSRAVGDSGKVIALEPDPTNYEALQINLTESGCKNVIVEHKAMASKAGTLLFSSEGNMGSAIVPVKTFRGKTIEVEATTLRDVITRHNLHKVGAIKLDIEGAEYGVLESSVDIIEKIDARWAIELHPDPLEETPVNVDRVRSIFDRLGYLTILQKGSDTVAAPTVFAFPRRRQ